MQLLEYDIIVLPSKTLSCASKRRSPQQCAGWVDPPSVPSFQCSRNLCKHLLIPLCAGAFHWLKHLWILPRFHGCLKIKLRTVDHEVIRLMVLAVTMKCWCKRSRARDTSFHVSRLSWLRYWMCCCHWCSSTARNSSSKPRGRQCLRRQDANILVLCLKNSCLAGKRLTRHFHLPVSRRIGAKDLAVQCQQQHGLE